MTPESFGRPLFFRIWLKNGVTDALPTWVILLRHTRHGARVNKGDAMAVWLTRRRGVSDNNQSNWRSAKVVNRKSRDRYFGVELRQLQLDKSACLPRAPHQNSNP